MRNKQRFIIDLFLLPLLLFPSDFFFFVHGSGSVDKKAVSLLSSHHSLRHITTKTTEQQERRHQAEEEQQQQQDASWDASAALANFSSRFLPHLYNNNLDEDVVDENQCSSIWSISMALDLVFPGSTNPNKEQMCQVLGFTCDSTGEEEGPGLGWRPFRKQKKEKLDIVGAVLEGEEEEDGLHWSPVREELETTYDGSCDECATVKVANSIWIDDGDSLQAPYQEAVGSDSLFTTDFDDPGAGSVVNQWINETTNGLIESVFPNGELSPAKLIAVNSIYFNAGWATIFQDMFTNIDKFYKNSMRLPSQVVMEEAHFMHAVGEMRYSHDVLPGYQLVQLGYQRTHMSMILALPIEHDDVDSMPPPPSHEEILQAIPQLSWEPVALALPKFEFGTTLTSTRLENALQASGLIKAFQPNAFCGIIEDQCLYISEIIQKTSINVHELGTIAACTTGITMDRSDTPNLPPSVILFQADHPFFFYIVAEGQSFHQIVLFEGYVQQPIVPPGAFPPTFQANHTDDDFWTGNFDNIDSSPWQP